MKVDDQMQAPAFVPVVELKFWKDLSEFRQRPAIVDIGSKQQVELDRSGLRRKVYRLRDYKQCITNPGCRR